MEKLAKWIVGDERLYIAWLDENPDGYVVNTRSRVDAGYFVLHRAACRTIRPDGRYVDGAFTERGYSKVVARSIDELRCFMVERGLGDFSARCWRCNP